MIQLDALSQAVSLEKQCQFDKYFPKNESHKSNIMIKVYQTSGSAFTCSKLTIETLDRPYSRPLLRSAIERCPLLQKLYKALF